NLVPTVATV
nr:Chain P, HCMV pp65 fragment 495-503, variant M5T (NLVPTVATV) [synthetic construct]